MMQRSLSALSLAALLVGCSDTVAVGGAHRVEVALQRTDAALPLATMLSTAASQGRLQVDQVDSLFITITSISFLRAVAEDDTLEAAWETLSLTDPVTIDLLSLPMEDDSAVVIAAGDLPAGDYERIRFRVSGSSIFLNTGVMIGKAVFVADTEYAVKVPSGTTSGLKTDLAVSVEDATAANLVFSTLATFDAVTATGNGQVILSPVLKAKGALE